MKRIAIIGSRRRNTGEDFKKVRDKFFEIYEPGDLIVSGGCPKGGDNFAEFISEDHDIWMVVWPAIWEIDGKFRRWAGFERNTIIAKNGDVLIACVAGDRKGGTEDTITKFKKFCPDGKIHLC